MPTEERQRIFRAVKRATVAVALVDSRRPDRPIEILGTGFCIDPSGIIVTCRHVLEAFMSKSIQKQTEEMAQEKHNDGQRIKTSGPMSRCQTLPVSIVFYDTEVPEGKVRALVCAVDLCMAKTDRDIALLRTPGHKYFPNGYPVLEVHDYPGLQEGDEVGVCGFPLGTNLQASLGTATSSFTRGMLSSVVPVPGAPMKHLRGFQLDVTATHGNSGGPAFSLANGKVFGVVQGGPMTPTGAEVPGLVFAEAVYPILPMVDELKAARHPQEPTGGQESGPPQSQTPT